MINLLHSDLKQQLRKKKISTWPFTNRAHSNIGERQIDRRLEGSTVNRAIVISSFPSVFQSNSVMI